MILILVLKRSVATLFQKFPTSVVGLIPPIALPVEDGWNIHITT
jgi:hypothetical protein